MWDICVKQMLVNMCDIYLCSHPQIDGKVKNPTHSMVMTTFPFITGDDYTLNVL